MLGAETWLTYRLVIILFERMGVGRVDSRNIPIPNPEKALRPVLGSDEGGAGCNKECSPLLPYDKPPLPPSLGPRTRLFQATTLDLHCKENQPGQGPHTREPKKEDRSCLLPMCGGCVTKDTCPFPIDWAPGTEKNRGHSLLAAPLNSET